MSPLAEIDATLAALLPAVAQQQDAYFATHGVYYQMLWTHSVPPAGLTAPDNLAALPIGQDPATVSGLPALMRSRMRIDTYGKPDGWTMTLQCSVDGEVWQRSIDCGVNPSRSAAWAVLSPLPE
jgi:hypothetical protein